MQLRHSQLGTFESFDELCYAVKMAFSKEACDRPFANANAPKDSYFQGHGANDAVRRNLLKWS